MKYKDIVAIYEVLKDAQIGGLSKEAKLAVIKAMMVLKRLYDNHQEEMKLAQEKIVTKEVQEAYSRIQQVNSDMEGKNMKDCPEDVRMAYFKDSEVVNKANADYAHATQGLADTLCDTDFERIGEDAVLQLIDDNKINMQSAMTLIEYLA